MNNAEYVQQLNTALDFLSANQPAVAETVLLKAIDQCPNKLDAYYLLGKIKAEHQGNIPEGERLMLRALDVAPFFEAYQSLAEFSFIKKDVNAALKYLKLALLYNSSSEKCISYMKRAFPDQMNFINENVTEIKGSYKNSFECPHIKYTKIYDAGTIKRISPKYIDELLTQHQRDILTHSINNVLEMEYPEGFAFKMQNGKVFIKQSCYPLFITPDKMLLDDTNQEPAAREECPKQNSLRFADKLLVLSSAMPGNYYHCLTWIVPRLQMIEQAGYNIKQFDKIAINYQGFKFQKELISLLGIPFEKIAGTNPKGVILGARELVSASSPNYKISPPIVVQSLREKLLKPEHYDSSSPKKIYLSRNKSAARHVLNEGDIIPFLEKEGFTIIYAEDFTVNEQIKLFANAEFVISQHGAGLTNLSFCSPGTKILEIHNENFRKYPDSGFIRIAADAKLNHLIMFGESVNNQDICIDFDKFKQNYDFFTAS